MNLVKKITNSKDYALFLLSRRDYSVGKLERKLKQKDFPPEEISSIIKFLLKNKFLDDQRFAEHYVRNQTNIKPTGKYKLSMKLKQNFISDDIIQKILVGISDENEMDSAKELADKKYSTLKNKHQGDKNKISEKLFRHLIGRGFGYEITKLVIDDLIK